MDLHDRDARDFCPRLVCVCVVVQELVAEHECDGQQTILASQLPLDRRILLLEPIDEEESQKDDVLGDLRGREDSRNPFPKARGRNGLQDQGLRLYGG